MKKLLECNTFFLIKLNFWKNHIRFNLLYILGQQHVDEPLKCFSCGKLGYDDCKAFDAANKEQVKVCGQDEVCLIYSWNKTPQEIGNYSHVFPDNIYGEKIIKVWHQNGIFSKKTLGIVRDCFLPSSITLGTPDNPIVPGLTCTTTSEHDIENEDGIQACLCTSPYCNDFLRLDSSKNSNVNHKPQQERKITTSTQTQNRSSSRELISSKSHSSKITTAKEQKGACSF